MWVKNFIETALSGMIFGIQGQVKYSLKLGKASLHRCPVGQTFCQIHSIWHDLRDTSIFVFCNLSKKFKISKWPPFLAGQKLS